MTSSAAHCAHCLFSWSFQYMDIFLGANLFQDFGPDTDGHFTEMGFAQNEHEGAGLADAPADAEWNFILQNSLVIGILQKIELGGKFQLLAKSFAVHTNAHGTEFVATPGDIIPDQNVAI